MARIERPCELTSMTRARDLHDATLLALRVDWATATLRIELRTGDQTAPRNDIIATGLRNLICDREQPWGPSSSVNEVRGPVELGDGSHRLEVELQSGDVIVVEAGRIEIAVADKANRITWGTTVSVRVGEPPQHRPGEIAEVVGITEANAHLATKYQVALGTPLYTIEFGDGTDVELPETALEIVTTRPG
jgi:hypothetical protein